MLLNETKRQTLLHVEQVLLNHIAPCFNPECVVTLLVRLPGNPKADVMLSTDPEPKEALAALQRAQARADQQDLVRNGALND